MMIDGEEATVHLHLVNDLVDDTPGAPRGRLEMSVDGRIFRPVCRSGFGADEALIFCRALGYDGRSATWWNMQKDAWRFAVGGVSCAGAESIDGCSANTETDIDA